MPTEFAVDPISAKPSNPKELPVKPTNRIPNSFALHNND